jgi:hypothetical protein
MSDPTVTAVSFYEFNCDRNPTSNEPVVDAQGLYTPDLEYQNLVFWFNQTTNQLFMGTNLLPENLVWQKIKSPVSRSYFFISAPAFNDIYQPSFTDDVVVVANITFSSTESINSQVDFKISEDGSTWSTIDSIQVNTNASTFSRSFNIVVPVGQYYSIVQTTGSVASINFINQITV